MGGGVLVAELGFEVMGEGAIPLQVFPATGGVVDDLKPGELVVELLEIAFVSDEGPVGGGDIGDIETVCGEDELAGELIEALQERERHGGGHESPQDDPVEVQVGWLGHVPEVGIETFGIEAALEGFDESLERSEVQGAPFGVEKAGAVEGGGDEERGDAAMGFGGAGELDSEAPGLEAFAVGPGEFQGDIADGGLPHVLGDTVLLLFGVAEAIALEGTVGSIAGGGLVEADEALISDQHELDEVHEDGLAGAGDPGEEEIAFDGDGIAVAIPVDGMDPGEADGAGHASLSTSTSSVWEEGLGSESGTEARYRSALRVHSSMSWNGMTRLRVGRISIREFSGAGSGVNRMRFFRWARVRISRRRLGLGWKRRSGENLAARESLSCWAVRRMGGDSPRSRMAVSNSYQRTRRTREASSFR